VRFLINLALFLLVAAAFAWWLRPYWGRWKKLYQNARNTLKFVQQVRDATKNVTVTKGSDFSRTASGQGKTVDVTPKMTIKVGCPVCKEMLSEAQQAAMRSGSVRCPAMIHQGANCPYYGRALN
jgi:hypothetical protein